MRSLRTSCFVFVVMSCTSYGAGTNLLPNGGFEDGVMRWRIDGRYPDLVAYYTPALHIDTEIAYRGLKSLRIDADLKATLLAGEAGGGGVVEGMPGKHFKQGLEAGVYLIALHSRTQEVRPPGAVTFSYRVLDAQRREVSSGSLGSMPQKSSSFIEHWRLFQERAQVPQDGIVEVSISAVADGRVGHVWIDDVSVTKVHNDKPPPPSPPTATLSVSAREGRKLPIFTNEPALVKVATHHLDPTRSYRLVLTVTDYWDRQVDQKVFNLDATEQFQTEVQIKKTGWYTVLVSLLGGKHPVQQGTKLAVLDFDPSRIPDRDTLFGVWAPFYPSDVQQLGLTWINALMTWSQIEPRRGEFNWSTTDTPLKFDYDLIIPHGMARRYQIVMDSIPAWAAKNERVEKGPPKDWEQYRRFVQKLVAFTGDKVDVWDVMNEVMGRKWGGSLEELFMLHKVTAEAVKSVNPNARIIGPACGSHGAGNYEKDVEKMLAWGLGQVLDGIAIHPYRPAFPSDQGPENTLFEDELLRWGLMAEKYGLKRNDLWITEVGVPVTGTARYWGTRRQQAEWMVRMHLVALKLDLPCFIWFKGRASGSIGPQEEALIDKGGRPRRMYAAYVTMTQQLAAADFRYELDTLGSTAMGHVYERDGQPLLALWDWKKQSDAKIHVGVDEVTIVDIVGGKRSVRTHDGWLDIELTPDVKYIQDSARSLFLDQKARSITPDRELIQTDHGRPEQMKVSLANRFRHQRVFDFDVDAPKGWLLPEVQPQLIALNPGENKDVVVSFIVPPDERWGLHRLTLTLHDRGALVARLPVHVHIDGPRADAMANN